MREAQDETVRTSTAARVIDVCRMSCVIWAKMAFRKLATPLTVFLRRTVRP